MPSESSESGMDQVGAACDDCDWTLTIGGVVDRIGEGRASHKPTARRVREKFGSLAEGHAYFNRGHTSQLRLSTEEIEEVLDR